MFWRSNSSDFSPRTGRKEIAQRFIAGLRGKQPQVPSGTKGETPMHSFVSCLMHCVFSTKERRRLITPDLEARLYPYLGGIARENKMKTLSIGGVEDHIHMLLSIPPTVPSAKAVQLLKRKFVEMRFMKPFQVSAPFNGKKVTEHSVHPSPA